MDKSQTLTVTAAAVLEGAKSSESAKAVLKAMFPKVFEDEKYFNLAPIADPYNFISSNPEKWREVGFVTMNGRPAIQVRGCGNFQNKGFYLHNGFDWEIVKDSAGETVLVPTKKS